MGNGRLGEMSLVWWMGCGAEPCCRGEIVSRSLTLGMWALAGRLLSASASMRRWWIGGPTLGDPVVRTLDRKPR
ncbi:MAG: hypothetical protein OJF50_000152 [Nitrospira sp.]|nr:hypothetical protein [Nitrospira sp.]